MKRFFTLILVAIIVLVSCEKKETIMYLEPNVEVSEYVREFYADEANVVGFGFHVGDDVQKFGIKRHRLVNGEWQEEHTQYEHVLTDENGYISLDVDCHTSKMTLGTITMENSKETSRSIGGFGSYDEALKYKTILLDDKVNIEYEKDIPLFVQVDIDKELPNTFTDLDELVELLKEFEEDVFLITLEFSNYIGTIRKESVKEIKQETLEIKIEEMTYYINLECTIEGQYSYKLIDNNIYVEEVILLPQIMNYNNENSTLPKSIQPYVKRVGYRQVEDKLEYYVNLGFKQDSKELNMNPIVVLKYEIDLYK